MRHLYTNDDGEMVAADTPEQAAAYYAATSGEPQEKWATVRDDEPVTMEMDDGPQTKTAAEWAAGFTAPMLACTCYT